MKTKIAILDSNQNYVRRLLNSFQTMYCDKLELNVFSNEEQLYCDLKKIVFDVILVDEKLNIEKEMIPKGIGVAYLCESMSIEELRGFPAICKYQRADLIYKQILGLHQEINSDQKIKSGKPSSKVVIFTSAQGGAGTSTAAAAFAFYKSKHQKKVFYLNLEFLGMSDTYFSDEGNSNFSDVIYNLKLKRNNFLLKLESLLKTDKSQVDFFSSCIDPNDMKEVKNEEIVCLLEGVSQLKPYDYLIIDASGTQWERMDFLMKNLDCQVVYVCDGSETGITKLKRFCDIVRREEEREEKVILRKITLLYNRCKYTDILLPETIRLLEAGRIEEKTAFEVRRLTELISEEEALKHI